ncbi:MAG: alpha/beta fold hydrolase [Candidatus Hodarchaeales archaeon]
MQRFHNKLAIGKQIEVAYTISSKIRENTPTIVFIHGFGSSKEFFRHAFNNPSLSHYNLIALDLIGFGDSSNPEGFSYEMSNQASLMYQLLIQLGIKDFHLVAHSMGGLVGIEMISQSPSQVKSFANLEGNLTIEDCFISGKVLEYSFDRFKEKGRVEMEKSLVEFPTYLESFKKASDEALYHSAFHTVNISQDQNLLTSFIELPVRKCYIYGEKNTGKFVAEKELLARKASIYYVKDSDHNMAEQNPYSLFSIINEFILAK